MSSSRIYYRDPKCLDFTATVIEQWTAEGGVRIEGAVIDCDESGRATAIEPVRVDYP